VDYDRIMRIYSRQDWGAVPPKWSTRLSRSEGMFLHYNGQAVAESVANGHTEAVFAWLRNVQRYHMNDQGWPDIAYSFCCTAAGDIVSLRGWGVVGAHTMGWNDRSHAIVFPVGDSQPITNAQIEAANFLIADHDRRYGVGFIRGHKQAPNATSCPGGPIMGAINAGRFRPVPPPQPPQPTPGVKMKPVMMQEPDGTIWLYYENSPFRIHVKTPADANTYRFFGVELKVVNADQAAFFRRNSQQVKTG